MFLLKNGEKTVKNGENIENSVGSSVLLYPRCGFILSGKSAAFFLRFLAAAALSRGAFCDDLPFVLGDGYENIMLHAPPK